MCKQQNEYNSLLTRVKRPLKRLSNNIGSFPKRGLTNVFFQYFNFLKIFYLDIASYEPRTGVSVTMLYDAEFLISHTIQRKRYISIARTVNFIMYVLGFFLRKRSHMHIP